MNTYSTPRGQLTGSSIDQIISRMTLQEKAQIIVGAKPTWTVGRVSGIPRFGIPEVILADGPAGVNLWKRTHHGQAHSTFFPDPTLLASTWDLPLVEEMGKAIGEETKDFGIDVLLSPGVNIHRNPLNGRNFEYFSEDPIVAGEMGAAHIRGVQSNGVGTSLKHLIMNNQETYRYRNSAVASARTIREIYLKPFEIAIKTEPWMVMSSYNQLFGRQTCESPDLITRLLREEWGFKGLVTTDWGAGQDGKQIMLAGNEMIQDYQPHYFRQVMRAPEEVLNRNVHRILEFVLRTRSFRHEKATDEPDLEGHSALIRRIAPQGMTLLKNTNNTLPLPPDCPVALFGRTSYDTLAGGTGCAIAPAKKVVTLLEGLTAYKHPCDPTLVAEYTKFVQHQKEIAPEVGDYDPHVMMPEMAVTESLVAAAATSSAAAIFTIGKISGENYDRRLDCEYGLDPVETFSLQEVCKAFHAQKKPVIVVLNIPAPVEITSWRDDVDAILLAWYPGQEAGFSIAEVLSGAANPCGKITMTWPLKYTDLPSSANFPDITKFTREEYAYLNMLDPSVSLEGRDHCIKETRYEEGIYVGYRHFCTQHLPVAYPFGYGLSYTTFEYSNPTVTRKDGIITVTIDITNTGAMAGKEIVQVYVSAPGKDMPKPERELKGFGKTAELKPGEKSTLAITIPEDRLASFDEKTDRWVIEGGEHKLLIAASCEDVKHTLSVTLEPRVVLQCLHLFHNLS